MYVAAVLLHGVADHVRARGFTTDQLLLGTGIGPGQLDDPSARLPLGAVTSVTVGLPKREYW